MGPGQDSAPPWGVLQPGAGRPALTSSRDEQSYLLPDLVYYRGLNSADHSDHVATLGGPQTPRADNARKLQPRLLPLSDHHVPRPRPGHSPSIARDHRDEDGFIRRGTGCPQDEDRALLVGLGLGRAEGEHHQRYIARGHIAS